MMQIRNIQVRIDITRNELADISAMLGVHSPEIGKVGSAPRNSYVRDKTQLILTLSEKREELEKEIIDYLNKVSEVKDTILQLQNPLEVEVLHRRYFLNQHFTRMSDDLGYTEKYLVKVHLQALKEIEEIINKVPKVVE